jgi:hypothetical protein
MSKKQNLPRMMDALKELEHDTHGLKFIRLWMVFVAGCLLAIAELLANILHRMNHPMTAPHEGEADGKAHCS